MREAILHLSKNDPVMARIIRQVGPYQLTVRKPTIETLVRSIVSQQVSGKAATSIFNRVKKAVGRSFSAAAIRKLTVEELRACGLSQQKAAYIHHLADCVLTKTVSFRRIVLLPDHEVIEHLTQVKGIGVWTVQMFLMFALERPNVLPLGDLGIRNAVMKAYGLETPPKPAEIAAIAEKWHPYCSVASWYLWRSLDGEAQL